ncbi:MAG: DUF533 domain-containing protein [Kofleriaceae bacterium]
MGESQVSGVIRIWAAIAWADGVLAETEADGLRRLIRGVELSPEERAEAMKLLDKRVEIPETYLTSLTPDARHGIYRAACRMAMVDHVFAAAERNVLVKLRGLLGLPDDVAQEIEADVPGLE